MSTNVSRQRTGLRGKPEKLDNTEGGSEATAKKLESGNLQHANKNIKETLTFSSFVRAISVMTRGSPLEKARLIWCIFAGNETSVSSSSIYNYVCALSNALLEQGYSSETYGDPEEFINSLVYVQNFEDGTSSPDSLEGNPSDDDESSDFCKIENSRTALTTLTREFFLQRLTETPNMTDLFGLCDFFENRFVKPIERQVFIQRNSQQSGWLSKDKGETIISAVQQLLTSADRRFFLLRGSFLAYFMSDKNIGKPLRVLNMDYTVAVRRVSNTTFQIEVPGQFNRTLYCKNIDELDVWVSSLRNKTLQRNRFNSFSPLTRSQRATWFVNGKEYFRFLVSMLRAAQKRVYIADWYFSPGVYLIREPVIDKSTRIDRILKELAERGVMVYLLIWNASSFTFDLQSQYVCQYMSSLHPNIRCVSHPTIYPFLWTHHQKFVVVDEQVATCGGIDICYGRYENDSYLLRDTNNIYKGRDYNNINYTIGESNGPTNSDLCSRNICRMPWHDIHMGFAGASADGVTHNFIQRWNHVQRTQNVEQEWLFPLSEAEKCPPEFYWQKLPEDLKGYRNCDIQILRSTGDWSTGQPIPEDSIYKAYISTIKNAKKYIYIENQYFISSIDRIRPKNKILEAIYRRLRKAIMNSEKFKVILILPVFPAGDIMNAATQYLIKYTYKTLNRQSDSLLERLKSDFPGVDLSYYISVNSLRNWTVIGDKVQTEPIYVHAKLMIVDDRTVIIGSANINDRSMRGSRDTELCAITEGTDMISIQLNGKPYQASQFAYNLRIKLMSSFLGFSEEVGRSRVMDICSDSAWTTWCTTASRNTSIYLQVFKRMPDNIYSLADLVHLMPGATSQDVSEQVRLKKIRGFLCEFPMDFLKDAQLDLSPGLASAEWVVPRQTFL
eukprot:TRINITY_DN4263_c0_g3_i1.p1 TRINITY_DN4263_c0_g3~~TRINITY_DN4263_c0_g3_i1.p1  ORF type:complete len:998 (+),score=126.65 TRINITY_DN4263_c0_g3_i1:308-2995(+)